MTDLPAALEGRTDALVVGATALLGWLVAVTAVDGWGDATVVVWTLVLFAVAGAILWWDGSGR